MSGWTEELVASLRERLAAGDSYSEIAGLRPFREAGLTRNSLIGKAHRLGLKGSGKPAPREKPVSPALAPLPPRKSAVALAADDAAMAKLKEAAAEEAPRAKRGFGFENNVRSATPAEIAAAATRAAIEAAKPPPKSGAAVGFDDLAPGMTQCRYPLWRTYSRPKLEEMRFCGEPTTLGSSWCPSCRKLVFPGDTSKDKKAA